MTLRFINVGVFGSSDVITLLSDAVCCKKGFSGVMVPF